ncbi:MAG: DUF1549 domain-containing protein [Opitutales bacterium]
MRFAKWLLLLAAFLSLALPWVNAGESLRKVIDREIVKTWKEKKLEPAVVATEAAFLRRVYLDLVGAVPSYAETQAFLDDGEEGKRAKLVDHLLADERHARHQAETWDLIFFSRKPANPSATRKRERFQEWLRKQFAENIPWDALVRKILLANEDGSAMFHVQYRNKPEDETVALSRIFLGTQLQCARCHDHPYEERTQRDFYGMAGFLVRLSVQEKKEGKEKLWRIEEKSSGEVLFTGEVKEQERGQKGTPVKPKFLDGEELDEPALPEDFEEPDYKKLKGTWPKPVFSRKAKLAKWLTSANNPFFTKAIVNRVWSQFMGRGLVHPVDDLNPENEASHPALLEALTKWFVEQKYDLRTLIREIVLSEAYALASAGDDKAASPKWYDRARVRPLSAEELMASLRVATGFDEAEGREKKLPNAGKDYIMRFFGKPNDGRGRFQGGVDEHLFLNNGSQLRSMIQRKKGNLSDLLLSSEAPWEERMDRLFLSTLTRLPTEAEREKFTTYVTVEEKPQGRLEEAIWALLNSSQFRFNH